VDDDDVLVVHGPSRAFNPLLPEKVVEDALRRDQLAARAEWLAEWRSDIAAFLRRELVESAIDRGVTVRPPEQGVEYFAFADPSGGVGDSYTAAVAHRDAEGRCMLDCLRKTLAPFDPAQATAEIAKVLKAYGVSRVWLKHCLTCDACHCARPTVVLLSQRPFSTRRRSRPLRQRHEGR
jgi:hypothetical protein